MYYSNGNYEAFARPRTPKKAEGKSAWLVGGGLASLSAAALPASRRRPSSSGTAASPASASTF